MLFRKHSLPRVTNEFLVLLGLLTVLHNIVSSNLIFTNALSVTTQPEDSNLKPNCVTLLLKDLNFLSNLRFGMSQNIFYWLINVFPFFAFFLVKTRS